ERQADPSEIGRMLRLGIDANGAPDDVTKRLNDVEYLVERRHRELSVIRVRAGRQALACPEALDFGNSEVFTEPAGHRLTVDGLGPLSIWKPLGGISRRADLVFMPRDQHAVLGGHQVGLDEVS